MTKPIVVGFDFDGVIAYNPARVIRYPVSLFKRYVLGIERIRFYVPQTALGRTFWAVGHESSVFPALGTRELRQLVKSGRIEAHLVTSRFGFLEPNLRHFLDRWHLSGVFSSVTLNYREEQPHEFKTRVIRAKKFHYYVEDNWDIVSYLSHQKLSTDIHWIYNIFDRNRAYAHKFPYLGKSLEAIVKS